MIHIRRHKHARTHKHCSWLTQREKREARLRMSRSCLAFEGRCCSSETAAERNNGEKKKGKCYSLGFRRPACFWLRGNRSGEERQLAASLIAQRVRRGARPGSDFRVVYSVQAPPLRAPPQRAREKTSARRTKGLSIQACAKYVHFVQIHTWSRVYFVCIHRDIYIHFEGTWVPTRASMIVKQPG